MAKKKNKLPRHILISRTDGIGDVMLTLPMCYLLKKENPELIISFLAQPYTTPVIDCCTAVDHFINLTDFLQLKEDDLIPYDTIIHVFPRANIAKKARELGIETRIGTTGRLYHIMYCNQLVSLSRKNSPFHESQLNLRLLEGINQHISLSIEDLGKLNCLERSEPLKKEFQVLLDPKKTNIILHPKSKGSAKEWPTDAYGKLIELLNKDEYKIFVTGTLSEGELIEDLITHYADVITDLTGKMDLAQFISFIKEADALVACSTGPLHIAAAAGIHTIGLYVPVRPIHAGRWAPIGQNVTIVESRSERMQDILPKTVLEAIKK